MPIATTRVRGRSAWRASSAIRSKQLAGVHDAVWIERALDGPHRAECHRRGISLQLFALETANAMFGADTAGKLCHQIMDRAANPRLLRQEQLGALAIDAVDIEMQIAIARVSVAHQYAIGDVGAHPERSLIDKLRQRGYRYAYIVLEARAGMALRLRHGLAQPPEGGTHALAGGDRRVQQQ